TTRGGGPVMYVSPQEDALLVLDRDDLYAIPLTPAGADGLRVNLSSPSVPLRRITTQGANYAQWVDGGRAIAWSFANHYYRAPRAAIMASPDTAQWGVTH